MSSLCPCSSNKAFASCCEPYIQGTKPAPTAEALMRSRYSAFATGAVEYLLATVLPDEDDPIDPDGLREWSEGSEWLGLEIVDTEAGGESDDEGVVEFIARFRPKDEPAGKVVEHKERSTFHRAEGKWILAHGEVAREPYRRETPRVGRNEPCPCGSGKKFKKCCANAPAAKA